MRDATPTPSFRPKQADAFAFTFAPANCRLCSEKSLFVFRGAQFSARNPHFERKTKSRGLFQGALDQRQAALGLFAH